MIHLQDGSQLGLAHAKGCAYRADPAGVRVRELDGFECGSFLVEENLVFDVSSHG